MLVGFGGGLHFASAGVPVACIGCYCGFLVFLAVLVGFWVLRGFGCFGVLWCGCGVLVGLAGTFLGFASCFRCLLYFPCVVWRNIDFLVW